MESYIIHWHRIGGFDDIVTIAPSYEIAVDNVKKELLDRIDRMYPKYCVYNIYKKYAVIRTLSYRPAGFMKKICANSKLDNFVMYKTIKNKYDYVYVPTKSHFKFVISKHVSSNSSGSSFVTDFSFLTECVPNKQKEPSPITYIPILDSNGNKFKLE